MKMISQLGDKALLGGAVYFAHHWLGKTEGFAVMTAFSVSVSFLGMLKLLFAEGRPFFLDTRVHPASCKDLEYGFPSGHATISTATYFTLLFCLIRKVPLLRDNITLQMLAMIALFGVVNVVCFSRLFLGVHSLDQLFVGFVIGAVICIWLCQTYNSSLNLTRSVILRDWGSATRIFTTAPYVVFTLA